MSANLVNYTLYQVGWLAAVIGASRGHPWIGASIAAVLVAVHVGLTRRRHEEMMLLATAGLTGLIVDSVQVAFGLLTFPSGTIVPWLCPPWIVVMWIQFATTLRFSLRWLGAHPMRAALFGAVGGPLAYGIGDRFGAVVLGTPVTLTLLVLAVVWAGAVPLLTVRATRTASAGYRLGPRSADP